MKRSLLFLLLATVFAPHAFAQAKSPNAPFPPTEAGKHVAAYLKAFNAEGETSMRSFFESHTCRRHVPLPAAAFLEFHYSRGVFRAPTGACSLAGGPLLIVRMPRASAVASPAGREPGGKAV